jgi:murein DD-endopeptidase MepM/ murein hydrolase activator NlpD
LVYTAVGATILAIPAPAAATTPKQGDSEAIKARVKRPSIDYGDEVVVVGRAPASDAGQTITLKLSSAWTSGWRPIASSRIRADGSFRLVAFLRRSGWLKAVTTAPPATASASAPVARASRASSSAPQPVAVQAAVRLRPRAINERGARRIDIRGRLVPGTAGRRVVLQGARSGRWVTLSAARTSSRGAFNLRYRPKGLGHERLRVRFMGDRTNAAVSKRAGSLTVYRQALASWYDDGGSTACGFHAHYGVANLSLPCGTPVSFMHGGRVVEAVVDDRGPYAAGRAWDLNQNTAAELGMAGVATVWSSR